MNFTRVDFVVLIPVLRVFSQYPISLRRCCSLFEVSREFRSHANTAVSSANVAVQIFTELGLFETLDISRHRLEPNISQIIINYKSRFAFEKFNEVVNYHLVYNS